MTDRLYAALAALEAAMPDLGPTEVPAVVARLGGVLAIVAARLAVVSQGTEASGTGVDRLLDIGEAAARTGMSKDWLYRHAKVLPFTRRIGRKLLFSEDGLARWMATRGR